MPTLAFLHGKDALTIEKSYEIFNFTFMAAMECETKTDPKNTFITEVEKSNCSSTGFYYHEQTEKMLSLEANLDETMGAFTIKGG